MCVEPTTALMIASAGSSLIQFQQAKAQQKAQFVAQKRQNELARANAIRRYATEQLKIRQLASQKSQKGFEATMKARRARAEFVTTADNTTINSSGIQLLDWKDTRLNKVLDSSLISTTVTNTLHNFLTGTGLNPSVWSEGDLVWLDDDLLKDHKRTLEMFNEMEDGKSNYHLVLLLKISKWLGIQPSKGNEINNFFDIKEATFSGIKPNHPHYLSIEETKIIHEILSTEWNEIQKIKITSIMRRKILNSIIHYYIFHIPGFKKPKALSILEEVFD